MPVISTFIDTEINGAKIKGTALYVPDLEKRINVGVIVSPEGKVTHSISLFPKKDANDPNYMESDVEYTLPNGSLMQLDTMSIAGFQQPPLLKEFIKEWLMFDPEKADATIARLREDVEEKSGKAAMQVFMEGITKLANEAAAHLETGEDSKKNIKRRMKGEVKNVMERAANAADSQKILGYIFGGGSGAEAKKFFSASFQVNFLAN
jgi:hypothetical protein